ncbi:MAG TPA: TRAM domain-containing protein [Candidatus Omnitrophica bacterium]|nr:TRAM domain-containing protein [Candidatus Omnitrophota bacterium]
MAAVLVRTLFVLFCGITGYYLSSGLNVSLQMYIIGALAGLVGGAFVLILEWTLRKATPKGLIAGSVGLIIGLTLSKLLTSAILTFPFEPRISLVLKVAISLALGYLGMIVAWQKREEFRILLPDLSHPKEKKRKIIDTSVIIDGRIADIAETGFIEGTIIIPRFVLHELHQIADSSSSIRRRGRRGLDILNRMQKSSSMEIVVEEKDFPEIKDVDSKLVQLAKLMNGKIITNDYNLNKVARLQGVEVLNINELANALKPVILPNEEFKVRVVKEGKEPHQGIGYLDDGTMVVIEDAKGLIGEEVEVEVTSILQTSAGRMIFGQQKGSGSHLHKSS